MKRECGSRVQKPLSFVSSAEPIATSSHSKIFLDPDSPFPTTTSLLRFYTAPTLCLSRSNISLSALFHLGPTPLLGRSLPPHFLFFDVPPLRHPLRNFSARRNASCLSLRGESPYCRRPWRCGATEQCSDDGAT